MHAKKQNLQKAKYIKNGVQQKKSQVAKRSKNLLAKKKSMRMCDKYSPQQGLQVSLTEKVVVTDEDDKQLSDRWDHLWVPNYKPDSGYFSYWDIVEEITQEETEGW